MHYNINCCPGDKLVYCIFVFFYIPVPVGFMDINKQFCYNQAHFLFVYFIMVFINKQTVRLTLTFRKHEK